MFHQLIAYIFLRMFQGDLSHVYKSVFVRIVHVRNFHTIKVNEAEWQ